MKECKVYILDVLTCIDLNFDVPLPRERFIVGACHAVYLRQDGLDNTFTNKFTPRTSDIHFCSLTTPF